MVGCKGKNADVKIPDCTNKYMEYCNIKHYDISKLGKYKNKKLTVKNEGISDEEKTEYINNLLESYAYMEPICDRTVVENGDFVDISYRVYEGEEIVNEVSGDSLKVGAGYYNNEIEKTLIGKNVGDIYNIEIISDNGNQQRYEITIDEIKQYITFSLDDENFVKNTLGYSSKQEALAEITSKLQEQKEQEETDLAEEKLLLEVAEDSDIEFDEDELAIYAKQLVEQYNQLAYVNDMPLEEYYTEKMKLSENEFYEKCYQTAKESLEKELIAGAIALQENISVSDKEISEYKEKITEDEDEYTDALIEQKLLKEKVMKVFEKDE